MMDERAFTVAELIDLLKNTGVDPDTPVIVEGCDCIEECSGVIVDHGYAGYKDYLLVARYESNRTQDERYRQRQKEYEAAKTKKKADS